MKRRDFLVLAGGVWVWPRAGLAQAKVHRIGLLVPADTAPYVQPFREAMRKLGYVDGQNIELDVRSAHGKTERLAGLAAELVKSKVDVLVAFQTPAVTAAKQATREIPIVMSAGDPVGTGLIASLARPGGNITGMSATAVALGGKLLEILRETLPSANRVALLANARDPFTKGFVEQIERAGKGMSIEVLLFMIQSTGELADAFERLVAQRAAAVIVQPSLDRRVAIELAFKHRVPSVSPTSLFTEAGGLLSYSASGAEQHRVVATYVDRVLKGAKPADLPVQQPTKFDLGVNLKTARTLGITVPQSVLVRADRVIE
jgi:putative ABC transport system substrate-binding protein